MSQLFYYFFRILLRFLMLLLAGQTALAGSGIEISRDLSATSKANNLSLSYSLNAFENTETETVDLANRWSYDLTDALTTVNLNSLLADFAIKSVTHRLSYELVLVEDLTLAVKYGRTFFNSDEARQDVLAGGFYYQLGELQLGYAASNTDTYQVQKVELLSTDYTDTIRYNRKSGSYYLSFNWTKNLTTSVNFTQYNYDKNLDNSYAVLTTLPLLNRGSAAVANDVGSQLKSSLDLNLAFFLTRRLLLTLGVGTAQDYLSPSAKSNDISMGIDYEILIDDVSYRLFGLLNVGRTDEVEGTSNSGQLGIGFNF